MQQFVEPGIPQVAGCHLDRNALTIGSLLSIKVSNVTGYPHILSPLPHKVLVSVGFLAAQAKIAVRQGKGKIGPAEKLRHHHRIHAAAHGQEGRGFVESQAVFVNKS